MSENKKDEDSESEKRVKVEVFTTLSNFKFERILNVLKDSSVWVVANTLDENPQRALIKFDRGTFAEGDIPLLFGVFDSDSNKCYESTKLPICLQDNNQYKKFTGSCDPKLNSIFVTVICPASDADILKYSPQPYVSIRETINIYDKIVKPFILSKVTQSELCWVYDIIEGKKEQNKIFYKDGWDWGVGDDSKVVGAFDDPAFLLLPDMKWDEKNVRNLYVLGIVRTKTIHSLRALTADHLPLLRRINEVGKAQVALKYNVPTNNILSFVHYLPAFYHFHVHFVIISRGDEFSASRAHLLDDIIDNLEKDGNFYLKTNLTIVIPETNPIAISLKPGI